MRRSRKVGSAWRPGPDTAIALVALVLAAGGVSWAVTRAAAPAVITACTSPSSGNIMMLSSTGSCTAGATTVQWNQQGPTGPQGVPGLIGPKGPAGQNASQPILAYAHTTRYYRFAVDYNFTATGTYLVDGTVTERVNTANWSHATYQRFGVPGITCYLLAGQYPSQLTALDQEPQSWAYFGGTINRYYPLTVDGPYGAGADVKVPSLPYLARFQCRGTVSKNGKVTRYANLPNTAFVDPTITAQPVSNQTLSISKLTVVGPVRPTIGPGPR
jgi:hypothetical protein